MEMSVKAGGQAVTVEQPKSKPSDRSNAKREELIYLAREIYPAYPGLLDLLAWEHGRAIRARTKKSN